MKKMIMATVISCVLGVSAYAIAADNTVSNERVEQISKEFQLNEQQAKHLQRLLTNAGKKPEEIKAERMQKHMEMRLQRMQKKLELTDEQTSKIKDIMAKQREEMQALRQQHMDAIKAVLTPEQAEKAEQMKMHERGGMMRHHGGGKHGKHHGHKGKHGSHEGMCDKAAE